MTEKQENILKAALELFAQEGYHATSTQKIAKRAGVSEGLIFRHFENKEGLLKAILSEGEAQVKHLYADIVLETDPKVLIRKSLELPFKVKESEYEFWKLQFKLKWELADESQKLEPLFLALSHAFKKLNSEQPELEAELVIYLLDGISGAILKNALKNKQAFKDFLIHKYNL